MATPPTLVDPPGWTTASATGNRGSTPMPNRPRIFTADFWARRLDAVTDGIPRMVRTGAQFVIGATGASEVTPIDAFALDWRTVAGSFAGGCIVWVFTTLAAPPRE